MDSPLHEQHNNNNNNNNEQSLLPAEQKGCHPGSKGCKDQLMISKAIYEHCRRRN